MAFFIRQIRQKELLQICNFRKNAEIEKKIKIAQIPLFRRNLGKLTIYIVVFHLNLYVTKGYRIIKNTLFFARVLL